jgi:uncharacterized lipoprotein YddW (UPF0748 family)
MNAAARFVRLSLVFVLIAGVADSQERELRGLWMTPREGSRLWSREEIRIAMKQTADANFNTVYFLAWSRGWPLWRSRLFQSEFGFSTDPAAGERDILAEAVDAAHEAGLHIEAWMEYGFVGWWSGNGIDSLPLGPIFRRHPEWLARDSKGSAEYVSGHVGTFYWMAHSQPAVQSFLADLHAEVADEYDVDGIELDRIRYPRNDCGYDSTTVTLYAQGHAGAQPPMDFSELEWMRWRADRIVEFQRIAFQRIKRANPRIVVSNAPGHYTTGDEYGSYEEYLQDWRQWLKDGSVELVQIQMYAQPEEFERLVTSALRPLADSLRRRTTSGLAVKPGGKALTSNEVMRLVKIARRYTPTGHAFWYFNDLRDAGLLQTLKKEVYQSRALYPLAHNDRFDVRMVRKGVRHHSITLEGPYTLDVLEVDLKQKGVRIETFRADSLRTTTEQVRRREAKGAKVIGAVNADFFSFKTHWPVGSQASRGAWVVGLPSRRSHFAVTSARRPVMDPMSFKGSVSTSGGVMVPVRAINDLLDSSGTVMYNARWGPSTRTIKGTCEMVLRPVAEPRPNGMGKFIVDRVGMDGNAAISGGSWVWSSMKGGEPVLQKGDTVLVSLRLWENEEMLDEIVGAGGRILRDGRNVDNEEHRREGIGIKFTTDRHPRTFVGMSEDSSVLYLGTVDGRQASSIGMDFREMARFLRSIGAWNAVNLDGGGSTTMVVEGQIVNSPSDRTGERAVANTIMVIEEQ